MEKVLGKLFITTKTLIFESISHLVDKNFLLVPRDNHKQRTWISQSCKRLRYNIWGKNKGRTLIQEKHKKHVITFSPSLLSCHSPVQSSYLLDTGTQNSR